MIVVLFALILGGSALAGVAASILYVHGVVTGLENLPPWLQAVQLALSSQQDIDEILLLDDRIKVPEGDISAPNPSGNAAPTSAPATGLSIRRVTK